MEVFLNSRLGYYVLLICRQSKLDFGPEDNKIAFYNFNSKMYDSYSLVEITCGEAEFAYSNLVIVNVCGDYFF